MPHLPEASGRGTVQPCHNQEKIMTDNTYTNRYGLVFDNQEELEAWDAYVEERLAKARQSPTISHEEMQERFRLLEEKIRDAERNYKTVPHTLV